MERMKSKAYEQACAEMHTLVVDGWRLIGQYRIEDYDLIVMRHSNGSRLSIRVELTGFKVKVDGKLKKAVYV